MNSEGTNTNNVGSQASSNDVHVLNMTRNAVGNAINRTINEIEHADPESIRADLLKARLADLRNRARILRGGHSRGPFDYQDVLSTGGIHGYADSAVQHIHGVVRSVLQSASTTEQSEETNAASAMDSSQETNAASTTDSSQETNAASTMDSSQETNAASTTDSSQDTNAASTTDSSQDILFDFARAAVDEVVQDVNVQAEHEFARGVNTAQRRGGRKKSKRNNYDRHSLKKEVVCELMTDMGETLDESGKKKKNFRCLKCDRLISFLANSGWTNSHGHLERCYGRKDLLEMKERAKLNNVSLLDMLLSTKSDIVAHLHNYLKMAIHGNLPIKFCENEFYRTLTSKFPNLSYRLVRDTINRLVSIVREKIKVEMKGAERGSIMYDAWTRFNNHYVAILVVFVHPETDEVTSRLVTVRPLMRGDKVGEESAPLREGDGRVVEIEIPVHGPNGPTTQTESFVFTAEAYADHVRNEFSKLEIDLDEWLVCQITDNASVMAKVARLLGIYHVGCKNHGVHLTIAEAIPVGQTEARINSHPNRDLINTAKSVNQTMRDAKNQGKTGAILRSLTIYRPMIMVLNRWSSLFYMLLRWNKINAELRQVFAHADSNLRMDLSEGHQSSVDKLILCLEPCQLVTKRLQEKHLSLSTTWRLVDALVNDILPVLRRDENFHVDTRRLKLNIDNPLFKRLDDVYFESAVCKLLRREEHLILPSEERTLTRLRKSTSTSSTAISESSNAEGDRPINPQVALLQRVYQINDNEPVAQYYDARFVLGSSAECERIFSITSYVLLNNRSLLTNDMFEAIMFLRYNSELWGLEDVSDAYYGRVNGDSLPVAGTEETTTSAGNDGQDVNELEFLRDLEMNEFAEADI